jgi:hypothetical protein
MMRRLPPLLPYPAPGEHPAENAAGATDTASIASSSRKRKRSDYEVSVLDLRNTGGPPKVLNGEGTVPDGGEQTNTNPRMATPPASQKRTRRQGEKETREEANRKKREKERVRRGEQIWSWYDCDAFAKNPPEQRKAQQADAAAKRQEELRATKQVNRENSIKGSSIQADEAKDDSDGMLSSTSSLTDLEDANSDKGMEESGDGAQKRERRATLPRTRVRKEPPRRPPRSHQPVHPPRRNPRTSAPVPEKRMIEIPAGFKLQIGPGTKPRLRDEVNPTKQKREHVMGEPPKLNDNGQMESGTYGRHSNHGLDQCSDARLSTAVWAKQGTSDTTTSQNIEY